MTSLKLKDKNSGEDLIYNKNTLQNAFKTACIYGQLEVSKWLYSLNDFTFDIHMLNDYIFRIVCNKGYIDVAKWLYSLGGISATKYYNNQMVLNYINREIMFDWLESVVKLEK